MAYTTCTKNKCTVRKGNDGTPLKTFTGKSRETSANKYVKALHKKNSPKSSNRGKAAKKRNTKRSRRR